MSDQDRLRISHVMMITGCVALLVAVYRLMANATVARQPLIFLFIIVQGLAVSSIPIAERLKHRERRFPADAGEWLWYVHGFLAVLLFLAGGLDRVRAEEYMAWILAAEILVWLLPAAILGGLPVIVLCILSAAGAFQEFAIAHRDPLALDIGPKALSALVMLCVVLLAARGATRRFVLYGFLATLLAGFEYELKRSPITYGLPDVHHFAIHQSLCLLITTYLGICAFRNRSQHYWSSWVGFLVDTATRMIYIAFVVSRFK